MLAVLITRELGGAVAVLGGLYTGFVVISAANRIHSSDAWPLYLISGGIFVSVALVCRWNPRD